MKRKYLGFTIIEILVVATVLAILMGLMFSAIKGVMNRTKKADCINNLKRLHQAVIVYTMDQGMDTQNLPSSLSVNFCKKYIGLPQEDLKCPAFSGDFTGYKVNHNLVKASNVLECDSIENLNTCNILIYEVSDQELTSQSGTQEFRHNNTCYGVSVYGDLVKFDKDDPDNNLKLDYKS